MVDSKTSFDQISGLVIFTLVYTWQSVPKNARDELCSMYSDPERLRIASHSYAETGRVRIVSHVTSILKPLEHTLPGICGASGSPGFAKSTFL